jgi:lysosomal Pro-X carboxypeptidase
MRIKYPSALDGVIAASAPILSFLGLDPPYNTDSFSQIMTVDASPECRSGIRTSWNIIESLASTANGRTTLTNIFKLCSPLTTQSQAMRLFGWASSAISYMAMGNYPYPTSYITNGGCNLPAWPFNLACGYFNNSRTNEQILEALRNFAGVFLNCTGKLTCFNLEATVNNETARDGRLWDYLWCTGIQQPFSQNGVTDMFWPSPYNLNDSIADCRRTWGVTPRVLYPLINYGGTRMQYASNIVFSNGVLDPWHGGGVLTSPSPSVVALLINNSAHHLDLMFSNPLDPDSVKQARQIELQNIQKWISEKQSKVDALKNPIQ